MDLQRACSKRYIHPHIIDWPEMEREGDSAGLPVLNWTAGYAKDVVEQVRDAWDQEVQNAEGGLRTHWEVNSVTVELSRDPVDEISVVFDQRDGTRTEEFKAVIFAVGFGEESGGASNYPYWEDDNLDKMDVNQTKSCLVSGHGDGGLTDLMRLCIKDFRHDVLVRKFASDPEALKAGKRARQMDIDFRAAILGGQVLPAKAEKTLVDFYQNLTIPAIIKEFKAGHLLRRDRKVYLSASNFRDIYRPLSMVLNRIILSQLNRLGAWQFQPGRPMAAFPEREDPPHSFRFQENGPATKYDIVVRRFGPTSTFKADFPNIHSLCQPLIKSWETMQPHLDRTRRPLRWGNVFDRPRNTATPWRMTGPARMVAFDLDGTLIQGNDFKYSWALVWRYLKCDKSVSKGLKADFEAGKFGYPAWCDLCAEQFRKKNLTRADFPTIVTGLHVVEGFREVIDTLRRANIRVILVSGGIDTILEEKIPDAWELFDEVHINQFRFNQEGHFESIEPTEFDFQGKTNAIRRACEKYAIPIKQVAFVGDSRNDDAVIGQVGMTIPFMAQSEKLKEFGDVPNIITPDLRLILDYVLKGLSLDEELTSDVIIGGSPQRDRSQ